MKKLFAISMALAVSLSCIPSMAYAETEGAATSAVKGNTAFVDMPSDWSTSALSNAAANGLLKGYKEGDGMYIKPSATLTRAEIAAIVNRAFGASETTTLKEVTDVSSEAWYATEIAKAVHMGTMSLAANMRPDDKITRQEAFSILARAFQLEATDPNYSALNAFQDKDYIASWAKEGICAFVEKGVLFGNDGKINPTANITRAEFAKIMDNMVQQYINTAGTVTKVAASGNVMINVSGVTLSNVTVNGDLIIGDGVGSGEVTLDSVKVTGETIVRGGGVHSVIIKGNSSFGKIIIAKVDGAVRVAVEGDADVEVVVIDDGKEDVIIEGKLGTVEVAADVPVVLQKASVEKVEVTIAKASVTIAAGA
ncbi:MAG: S-layer homology domain-containing protein, partial [Anaerotignum sp.]|nr:S-layer homology domain-containing protein [Anaerotignum sp.]